jgi:hypothetical protein
MLDDMALDYLLWVERKILLNCQIEQENFNKDLRLKKEKYLKQKNIFKQLETLNHKEIHE